MVANSVQNLQAPIAKGYARLLIILAILITFAWIPTTVILGRKPFDKRLEVNEEGLEFSQEHKWAFYTGFLLIGLHIFNIVIRGILSENPISLKFYQVSHFVGNYLVGLPLALIFIFGFNFGASGLLLGLSIGSLICGVTNLIYLSRMDFEEQVYFKVQDVED